MFSDHIIGTLRFIPFGEINNLPENMESMKNMRSASNGGLLFLKHRYDELSNANLLFINDNANEITEKLALASSIDESGALYEIIFTLKRELLEPTSILHSNPKSWDFIVSRESMQAIIEKFKRIPNSESNPLVESVSNDTFGDTTFDNNVEILIDGVDTFRRYYEVISFGLPYSTVYPVVDAPFSGFISGSTFHKYFSMGIIFRFWTDRNRICPLSTQGSTSFIQMDQSGGIYPFSLFKEIV